MLVCTPAPIIRVPGPVESIRSKPEASHDFHARSQDPDRLRHRRNLGFGEAICHRFHDAGAKVVGTGRRKDRLDALKSNWASAAM